LAQSPTNADPSNFKMKNLETIQFQEKRALFRDLTSVDSLTPKTQKRTRCRRQGAAVREAPCNPLAAAIKKQTRRRRINLAIAVA
jgi:hypothetical protein